WWRKPRLFRLYDFRFNNRRCRRWLYWNLDRLINTFAIVQGQTQMFSKIIGKHLFDIFGNALNTTLVRIDYCRLSVWVGIYFPMCMYNPRTVIENSIAGCAVSRFVTLAKQFFRFG